MILAYAAGATLCLGLMVLGTRLPFVPEWQIAKLVIVIAGTASALACIVGAAVLAWRTSPSTRRQRLVAVRALGGALLVVGAAWLIALDAFGATYLTHEELVARVQDPAGRGVLYVYSLSEIPDGVIESRVAGRRGWWMLERTLMRIPAPLVEVRQENGEAFMVFYFSGTVRYAFATGDVAHLEK